MRRLLWASWGIPSISREVVDSFMVLRVEWEVSLFPRRTAILQGDSLQ